VHSDEARFRDLYEAHFDAVCRYAQARADPDMAKDATSQTFLVAWRRRGEFFGARHPLAWLLGVTRRTLATERRAASRQSGLRDRIGSSVAPVPTDPVESVTERDAITAAFNGLRGADREVLALIAWDDLTAEEAAEVLGCSAATFAVKLHRARVRLRTQLRLLDSDNPAPPSSNSIMTSLITAEGHDS